jgi:hypothetical protein
VLAGLMSVAAAIGAQARLIQRSRRSADARRSIQARDGGVGRACSTMARK